MARQEINIGTAPTGAGGDTNRSGAVKINAMTQELYNRTDNLKSGAYSQVVGTVSQSGGIAVGAIIERGSNASGEYTKFADGTMICSSALTFSQAVTFSQDGVFIGATPVFGFPVAFIAPPKFTYNARAMTVFTQPSAVTATTYQGLIMSQTSRSITAEFVMTAQGRWF